MTPDAYGALRGHLAQYEPAVDEALTVLSVPHWFDAELGHELVQRLTSANGSTSRTVARVTRLPFVNPYEGRGWRLSASGRWFFAGDATGATVVSSADALIAAYLDVRRNGFEHASGRELHWRFAYHAAPTEPDRAMQTIVALVESSSSEPADVNATVDLFDQRFAYFASAQGEQSFFQGMLAYRRKQYELAAEAFQKAIDSMNGATVQMLATTLLARILLNRPNPDLDSAVDLLNAALVHAAQASDRRGTEHATATLVDALLRRGTRADIERSEQLLGSTESAEALHVLGRALMRLGPDHWDDAGEKFDRALAVVHPDDFATLNGLRLSRSELAEARGDIALALAEMEEKLDVDLRAGHRGRAARDRDRIERLRLRLDT